MKELNFNPDRKELDMLQAINEAKRCLYCKNPTCKPHCPVDNDIPDFIYQLSKGNIGEARDILAKKTNLPAVCGRVCPHEKQCEGHCILNKAGKPPVLIGLLEQFIADFDYDMDLNKEKIVQKTRGKVAVIGSGPAGLTVAGDLARIGFNVTVYEYETEPGGVLIYGIPEFRLPRHVVRREISRIASLGVNFITNTTVGVDITVDEIFDQGFDAVFIGTGTAIAKDLKLPGYDLKGVIQSLYFLRMLALYKDREVSRAEVPLTPGDHILVIGAGNVAMDAARTALRAGAGAVTVIYHKGAHEISALQVEYQAALEDGVGFSWYTNTLEFVGNEEGNFIGLKVNKEGNEEIIYGDKVFLAVGSRPADRVISTTTGIRIDESGYVITKKTPYGMTSRKGVFAGGDVVHKPATVVLAVSEAKKVSTGIAAYIDAVKLLRDDD